MASFQTFFRTVVMLATLGIVAKVWYLYGPSVDEMKTIGARVAEVTSEAWNDYWQKPPNASLADDPRIPNVVRAPAPFVPIGAPGDEFRVGRIMGAEPHCRAASNSRAACRQRSSPFRRPDRAPLIDRLATYFAAGTDAFTARQCGRRSEQCALTITRATDATRDARRGTGCLGQPRRTHAFQLQYSLGEVAGLQSAFRGAAMTPVEAVEQVAAEVEAWQRGER